MCVQLQSCKDARAWFAGPEKELGGLQREGLGILLLMRSSSSRRPGPKGEPPQACKQGRLHRWHAHCDPKYILSLCNQVLSAPMLTQRWETREMVSVPAPIPLPSHSLESSFHLLEHHAFQALTALHSNNPIEKVPFSSGLLVLSQVTMEFCQILFLHMWQRSYDFFHICD